MSTCKNPATAEPSTLTDYAQFLAELKARVLDAHTGAARAVNRELILLQPAAEMPARGKKSADSDSSMDFVRQLVPEIPWGHHLLLLNKLTDPARTVMPTKK